MIDGTRHWLVASRPLHFSQEKKKQRHVSQIDAGGAHLNLQALVLRESLSPPPPEPIG